MVAGYLGTLGLEMRLSSAQADERSLADFGEEASTLLLRHDYSALANRFGYMLAFGREPALAIEADYLCAAASPFKISSSQHPSIVVKYFKPNSTGLFAVVECTVPVGNERAVLLELIVTGRDGERHIAVEDISGVPT